jgi:peptide deformylase
VGVSQYRILDTPRVRGGLSICNIQHPAFRIKISVRKILSVTYSNASAVWRLMMADLKITKYGSGVLREVAEPVGEITAEIRQIAKDMLRIMYDSDGVGLAAPQIGISKRIIVVDVNPYDPSYEPMVLINPEIVESEGQADAEEGCLSVPEIKGEVERAEKVTVVALNLDGRKVRVEGTDLLARALQHEIDHLNGTLFIDHLSRLRQQMIKKQLQKIEKETKLDARS